MPELVLNIETEMPKINRFLDRLTRGIENPKLYAVFKQPSCIDNEYNGQMIIREDCNDKIEFYTRPWIDPKLPKRLKDLDIDPYDLTPPNDTFSVRPENIPSVLRDKGPRRVITDGYGAYNMSVDFIENPYRLAGFEIGVHEWKMRIFASRRDKKAGVLQSKNKEAKKIFLELAKELL